MKATVCQENSCIAYTHRDYWRSGLEHFERHCNKWNMYDSNWLWIWNKTNLSDDWITTAAQTK